MWWDTQNLNAPRLDRRGKRWNFRVWHDAFTIGRTVSAVRVFYWDDGRNSTGVVLLGPDTSHHVRDVHALIQKLTSSDLLRAAHQRELQFPLERFYSEYGAFPEEREVLAKLGPGPSHKG